MKHKDNNPLDKREQALLRKRQAANRELAVLSQWSSPRPTPAHAAAQQARSAAQVWNTRMSRPEKSLCAAHAVAFAPCGH